MNRKIFLSIATLCIVLNFYATTFTHTADYDNLPDNATQISFIDKIAHLEGVSNLTVLKTDNFVDKCVFFIEQPLDHHDPSKGVFKQRVFVSHKGFDRPTVFVTEGYGAAYGANARHTNELAELFNTNLIVVEHRYFLESTPVPRNWEFLTAENSANDLHHIFTVLKTVYPQKWISTGVSKGGQTTMIYQTFFPNDMDIAVPYVGPLNRGVEDGRHEIFLREIVGTSQDRAVIQAFQIELLKRRTKLMPLFAAHCTDRKFEFRTSLEEIFDLSVLEYPFAHWQYGTTIDKVPSITASDDELFSQFIAVSSPRYFQDYSTIESFYVQAERELGYYGYDIEPFAAYLSVKNPQGYLKKLVVPKDAEVSFDKTLYDKICAYLEKEDPRMVFIYGEYDPWSATAADVSVNMKNKQHIIVAYVPKGSHSANIRKLPDELQKRVIDTIAKWIE